jgi:glyoxylase-like metal-dependent hydrolase (beta-lactamase superfamily II)
MNTLAAGLSYVDLDFRGVPEIIATAVMHGPGGVALIDPGPTSTLPALRRSLDRAGIAVRDVTALLLTHIHLDHAGGSGTLVRDNPRLRVYVHEKGAPHMVNPEKLIASATRLYGDDMERLWGDVRPVPPEAIVTLAGGERIEAAGRALDVAYTPGHASHHVSYFVRDTGIAFVGDTAGIRRRPIGFVLPPTPPPDIDIDQWHESLTRIGEWQADTLFLTHFGPWSPTAPHLTEFADQLERASALVRASLARDEPDAAREAWFAEEVRRELRRRVGDADERAYEVAGRFDLNWRGLARYWRKRA